VSDYSEIVKILQSQRKRPQKAYYGENQLQADERRSGIERRRLKYTHYVPDKRSGIDRRNILKRKDSTANRDHPAAATIGKWEEEKPKDNLKN
jgi:hypothetical protein